MARETGGYGGAADVGCADDDVDGGVCVGTTRGRAEVKVLVSKERRGGGGAGGRDGRMEGGGREEGGRREGGERFGAVGMEGKKGEGRRDLRRPSKDWIPCRQILVIAFALVIHVVGDDHSCRKARVAFYSPLLSHTCTAT